MSDEWLNTEAPGFAHAHNGFHYETLRVCCDFFGLEKITLPNGELFEINPSQLGGGKRRWTP
jgi:hypothetical protein